MLDAKKVAAKLSLILIEVGRCILRIKTVEKEQNEVRSDAWRED